MKNTLILTGLLLVSLTSFANDDLNQRLDQVAQQEQTCLDDPDNQNTIGMKGCTHDAFLAYDAILNQQYQKYVQFLKTKTNDSYQDDANKEILNRLLKSQRAWLALRDVNADLHATDALGGSLEGLIFISVRGEATRKRILELAEILNIQK